MPDEATMRRQMEAIQNNPALMQMFSQTMSQIASDPNALENLRRSNPEFDAMLRQQPQLAEQINNPEFLRRWPTHKLYRQCNICSASWGGVLLVVDSGDRRSEEWERLHR